MKKTRYFVFVNRPDGGSSVAGFIAECKTILEAEEAMNFATARLLKYHPSESIGFDIVRYTPDKEFHVVSAGWHGPLAQDGKNFVK
jgi:hypothetical protein